MCPEFALRTRSNSGAQTQLPSGQIFGVLQCERLSCRSLRCQPQLKSGNGSTMSGSLAVCCPWLLTTPTVVKRASGKSSTMIARGQWSGRRACSALVSPGVPVLSRCKALTGSLCICCATNRGVVLTNSRRVAGGHDRTYHTREVRRLPAGVDIMMGSELGSNTLVSRLIACE